MQFVIAPFIWLFQIRFGRFCSLGIVGTVVYWPLYTALISFEVTYIMASLVAFSANTFILFLPQKLWTFRNNGEEIRKQLGMFFLVRTGYFGINTTFLAALVESALFGPIVAQVVVTAVLTYPYYRLTGNKVFGATT